MASITDDKGYNQGFKPGKALTIRTERRCNHILSRIDNTEKRSILELGCGTGELSNLLAQKTKASVLGCDICKPFIEQAQSKYKLNNLRFEVIDLNKPEDFGNLKFDYIVGNGILHHLYYTLDDVLPNLKALLNPCGKLIFFEPNLYNPYILLIFKIPFLRRLAKLEPTEMAFGGEFIKIKLGKAGFQDYTVEYKDFLLPNTPSILIRPVIAIGWLLEKIPILKRLSQSVFITTNK